MRLQVFIILLTLLTGCCKETYFSIRTQSSDVFYRDVENVFFLSGHNIHKAKIFIENGNIRIDTLKKDTTNYLITVGEAPTTTITMIFKKQHYKYVYRNKMIPDPVIEVWTDTLFGLANETSAENFKTFKNLRLQLYNFDYNCSFKLTSYTMTRIQSNGKTESYEWREGNFNYISNAFTKLANKAESGDLYLFSDCIIMFIESNEIRKLRDYLIRIK